MTVLRLVWLASPCRLVSEAPWLPFGLSRCTHCNVSNSVYDSEQLRREQSRGSAYGSTRTDCGWGQYAHPPTGHRSSSSVTGCSLIIRCGTYLVALHCLRSASGSHSVSELVSLLVPPTCESFNSVKQSLKSADPKASRSASYHKPAWHRDLPFHGDPFW